MKRFQQKNCFLRKRSTKTKRQTIQTISLLNAKILQQMNKEKKKEKNTTNADKKLTNVNMKKIVKKKFEKKKENS